MQRVGGVKMATAWRLEKAARFASLSRWRHGLWSSSARIRSYSSNPGEILEEKKKRALLGGGEKRIKNQHAKVRCEDHCLLRMQLIHGRVN